ncbi:vanadium-dependent haloperoxidase [Lunatimonas salinarum]|uniref:vanadium-dependent haloperoxidase n=1 Tax=Lunatimonas salinarum TaxID=1774590 RepID=UPI001ADF60E4|nr:vanadium-dependent haloperoxidase [Lunatimonas salinarum]
MRWRRFGFLFLAIISCLSEQVMARVETIETPATKDVTLFIEHLFSATDVMVTDVATPTGAARFYAYILLGAYAVQAELVPDEVDPALFRRLNESFENKPFTGDVSDLNAAFCTIYSMLEVGKSIMPSGIKLAESQQLLITQFTKGGKIKKKHLADHIAYAEAKANQVIAYAATDGYRKLSTLRRYSPSPEKGRWYPTPPSYMAAIDPEWGTLRTFFLDDLPRFDPAPPVPFSEDRNSPFILLTEEVYQVTAALTEEQKLIANFWDCNPFFVAYSGHMAIGIKKISPGGHWIGITGIASQQAGLTFAETVHIHTLLALSLHDAFVSCWSEKYRSDRIRPITAINKYLDESWQPLLQTPPFPEYTSGHSVISRVSARVLSAYLGDDFNFIDTSEVYFGLPERAFSSFMQAAEEAAISRLYGGIHFRDAIEEGVKQGDKIADYILEINDPKGGASVSKLIK